MKWKLMKLGALLTQSKELSTAPDANRRIRVKLNVGGVEKRPVSNEVEGATNYYTRKAGQFIFGTQNFHKGAFGVIPPELDGFETSSDIPSFDVSKDCLPDWIFFYFKVGDRYKELEKLARGVGSKRVHPKQIFELEIPIPPVTEQLTIIEQVQASAARQRMIVEESDYQLANLTQLRQALLREAMQGQLLPQDPTDEPAAVLLKKLRAAKAATSKGGKGKAGALFEEEVEAVEGPFEIPESWEWCKLGELCFVTKLAGFEYSDHFKLSSQGDVPVVRAQNVKPNRLLEENLLYLSRETSLLLDRSALKGPSLLITFIGAGIGEVAIFDKKERWHLAPNVAKAELYLKDLSLKYLMWYLLSNYGVAEFFKITKATSQPSLSMGTIREVNIPLPPLAEQHRIAAKLEQLLQHCDALEQRIRESRRLAEQLLATALREALAPPTGATLPEATELELAKAETSAPHVRRAMAGKKRKVPASLGPLFD